MAPQGIIIVSPNHSLKSCLLYLAIFPRDYPIRRSTLIERWIVEGLISKEDWPTSVIHAERCFNTLIDSWLVNPGAVGATGQIKSCMVDKQVHEIITKMAKKHHMVEAANASATNDRYLKGICNKIVLLKYLSLRRTDATCLPREINNLHELEILDIRDTKVPAPNTKEIVLLKLKRLMAGRTLYPSPSRNHSGKAISDGEPSFFNSLQVAKMENMEVLSNIEALGIRNLLREIGKLCHLRNLGVVISDKPSQLMNLLQVISDLNESLQYLSITLLESGSKGTPSNEDDNLWYDIHKIFVQPPKNLQSLNISGTAQTNQFLLLYLLAKGMDKLIKGSNMTEVCFEDGAAPKLECIKLSSATIIARIIENAATPWLKKIDLSDARVTTIRFEKGSAPDLQEISMSSTNITSINFEDNATPNLKKMALSNTNIEGDRELHDSRIADINDLGKVTLRVTKQKQADVKILARQPNLESLVLLTCDEAHGSHLSFNKDEFKDLKLLDVKHVGITKMSFAEGATPKLEKIAWSFNKIESLSGIKNLTNLKEVELSGENIPSQVREDIKNVFSSSLRI
uniref:NB-ARC domain-containing protein n=1 Tax=Oryza punctata TaxID=4537 RepID=A0A0E0MHK6_ORYPU